MKSVDSTASSFPYPSIQDTLMELHSGGHPSEGGGGSGVVVHGNGSPFLPPSPQRPQRPQPQRPQQQQQRQQHSSNNARGGRQNNSSSASSSSAAARPSRRGARPSENCDRSVGSKSVGSKSVGSKGSVGSNGSAKSTKKRLGRDYHFIPMMGRGGRRRRSDSDCESDDDDGGRGVDDIPSDEAVVFPSGRAKDENLKSNLKSAKTKEVGIGEGSKKYGAGEDSNLSDRDALRDVFTVRASSKIIEGAGPKKGFDEKNGRGNRSGNRHNSGKASNTTGPLRSGVGGSDPGLGRGIASENEAKDEPFASALGRRMWNQHKIRQRAEKAKNEKQNIRRHPSSFSTSILPLRYLPPPDFLRLPPTMIRIPSTSGKTTWANVEDLERRVLQHHLDLEASPLMLDEDDASRMEKIRGPSSSLLTSECFTRRIERDSQCGLGMSLREYDGCVYIQALLRRDGSRLEKDGAVEDEDIAGPAYRSGLLVGDRLLGLNGQPFLKKRPTAGGEAVASSEEMLRSVGDAIASAKDPMAVHVQREGDREPILKLLSQLRTEGKEKNAPAAKKGPPALRRTAMESKQAKRQKQQSAAVKPRGPIAHPFAKAMAERGLIKKGRQELLVTRQLRIFADRTRQWESKLSFRLRAGDYTLRPLLDARDVEPSYYASFLDDDGECPPYFDYKYARLARLYAPSTPMIGDWRREMGDGEGGFSPPPRRVEGRMSREAAIMADLYSGLDENDADVQDLILGGGRSGASNGEGGVAYPSSSVMRAIGESDDVFVPLVGIRKAICVRILNTFLDNRNRVAFTIWCYDVESGMEWYAPVRYYNDFKDLRSALLRVDKSIGNIPFPSLGWSLGSGLGFSSEAKESAKTREVRRGQLEVFLRRVFAGVYRGRLHPYLAEVAVHLQTFVGCDTVLGDGDDSSLSLSKQVAISESSYGKRNPDPKSEPNNNARMHLKRSIQRYVYRLFLLPSVEQLVSEFVDAATKKVTSEAPGPSKPQSHQFAVDKSEATKDVEKIRDFIDQVQELVLDGCRDDFVSLSQRRDFAALVDDADNSIRDNLFREAVREQTELEVYVPLRSTISKYLVYAWFNEDMEMKHKMKALADKPQSYFRIPKEHRSRSDWKSVSRILQEGVGRSTLPCVKLRAVVDAAKEISQLDSEERTHFPHASFFDGKVDSIPSKALGADDFLPIFIYCFVQAKIERPSALCELLSVMCDPRKMSGETGYYLASFHAALTHIHELDLTENDQDLSIIFDA